jgi:hypothetical protein
MKAISLKSSGILSSLYTWLLSQLRELTMPVWSVNRQSIDPSSPKHEEIYFWEYCTFQDVLQRLPYCTEEVYQKKPLHSSQGYLPPNELEAMFTQTDGTSPPQQPLCPILSKPRGTVQKQSEKDRNRRALPSFVARRRLSTGFNSIYFFEGG